MDKPDLDLDLVGHSRDQYRRVVSESAAFSEVERKRRDAAVLLKHFTFGFRAAVVFYHDLDARRQEGQLAEAAANPGVLERLDLFEYLVVGQKGNFRTRVVFGDLADFVYRLGHLAMIKTDTVAFAARFDLGLQKYRERVYDRRADPVQTPRNLVRIRVEFAARVKFGKNDFDGGTAFTLHHADRKPTPVVGDGRRTVGI